MTITKMACILYSWEPVKQLNLQLGYIFDDHIQRVQGPLANLLPVSVVICPKGCRILVEYLLCIFTLFYVHLLIKVAESGSYNKHKNVLFLHNRHKNFNKSIMKHIIWCTLRRRNLLHIIFLYRRYKIHTF